MRNKLAFSLIFLVFSSQLSYSQYYNTGQDPASIKWMQIKTGRFTVIYPEEYAAGGLEFARSLDESYSELMSLYPEKRFRMPVIIHSHSIHPNGYVSWAPRRMEIYPTPEQNTIPLDPVKQLTIHELTHVFQMTSLRKGFSKAMSFALGEQFTGIMASLLPLWFFEGQAVFAETILTESGRGRTPYFQKQLKAISLERGMFKYDKIVNGSYKDFVPDHYQTGYQMVTWAIAKYDPQIWNKVLGYTATRPFTINPVNLSLSKNADLKKKKLFNETFDILNTIWRKEVSENKTVDYKDLNPVKKDYINYYSPVFAGMDSILALKTSLSEPSEFVLVNPAEKSEKRIHVPGQVYPYVISYSHGKLVWAEIQSDRRWENRKYSVIKVLDVGKGKPRKLTKKSRYLAASISPDGRSIAAIENTIENSNRLVFLDALSGKVQNAVSSPDNVHLQRPQWSEDGKKISVIYLNSEGEGILSYSIHDNQWKIHVPAARNDLQSSFLKNDSLFYISSLSGTDNIFLRSPGNKTLQITRSEFGATDLSMNKHVLYFSDYSSTGNNISSAPVEGFIVNDEDNRDTSSFLINRIRINKDTIDHTGNSVYKAVPYRKWKHLFNFHSWMPFYADIEEIKADPTAIRPGVTVLTQNHLSTLVSQVGYEYSKEKNHEFHTRVTWMGWLPVIESRLDYGYDALIYRTREADPPSAIQTGLRFINTISLPLYFPAGKFSLFIRPSVSSDYRNNLIFMREDNLYDSDQSIFSGRIFVSNVYRSALRDIYPKWGQVADFNYSYAPLDKDIYGDILTLKTTFYFPGLFRDNGIRLRFEKESQNPSMFNYGNRVLLPRGYNDIISMKVDFLSADYVMPVAYPDFNISSFFYLKRIRTGLFYDYARATNNTYYAVTENGYGPVYRNASTETLKSYGLEVLADFHILRIPYEISAGISSAWKTFSEKPSIQLIFNIDLYGMSIGRKRY